MSTMCPACNGIIGSHPSCRCGTEMTDSGPVSDYYGPYSPYSGAGFAQRNCVHLFTCPACGRDSRVTFALVPVT